MRKDHLAAVRLLVAVVAIWCLLSAGLCGGSTVLAQPYEGDDYRSPLGQAVVLSCWSTCDIPQSNPYGDPCQCVHYAWKRAAQAGHKLPHWGDGHCWDDGARACGYTVSARPAPESVAVWESGQAGAWPGGHVAWVDAVQEGRFHVWHMNWGGPYCTATEGWFDVQEGISFIWLAATPTPTPSPTVPPPPITPIAFGFLPLVMKTSQ